MQRNRWSVWKPAVVLMLWAAAGTAYGLSAGAIFQVHQDVWCEDGMNCPNDFHVEGLVHSRPGSMPVLVDHIDDLFAAPNGTFSYSISATGTPGSYAFTADWVLTGPGAVGGIPYCTVLKLGLLWEVDAENVIIDVVGWWTRDGQPVGEVIPGLPNGGFVPVIGFDVDDIGGADGPFIRLANGNTVQPPNPQTEPIQVEIVQMDLAAFAPGEQPSFRDLASGTAVIPWVEVLDEQGQPISPINPESIPPDSFFDVFFEIDVPGLPRPAQPLDLVPGGFLVSQQKVEFINNNGQPEERWFFEYHQSQEPEACCIEDGSTCMMLPPGECEQVYGGTPAGAGTMCLGDADGNGIDDACEQAEPKWIQPPDLNQTGMDVDATFDFILADDFLCTQRSLITKVTVWGSWEGEIDPDFQQAGGARFTLSLHKDIPDPDGPGPEYSMPGEVLWVKTFEPYSYFYDVEMANILEWWYNPAQQFAIFPGDQVCWRYEFDIPAAEAFCQEGTPDQPIVYWLDVQAEVMQAGTRFGWKTSYQHWNDDAVWGMGVEPFLGPWNELRYPFEHPWGGQSIDLAFAIAGDDPCPQEDLEFGDAPENALAYPASGVMGMFPTCMTVGPATWIQHTNFGAWMGPAFDFETDGNAGLCPMFAPYDSDECFADGDAGLLVPGSYTIDAANNVVPCPNSPAGPGLGTVCTNAGWGANIDVEVHNHMPNQTVGYVNVLIDWNQDGMWAGSSQCPSGVSVPEHVLVDFPVPNPYDGPLSGLVPPGFLIGPNPGHVWMRVSITERPVGAGWDGSGNFEDGETEDYLLLVDEEPQELDWGDAPDRPYPTLSANSGANHVIVPNMFLGQLIDAEPDGQPDATATGDDISNLPDEDGVAFLTPLARGRTATVQVTASMPGMLDAWIDFNGNGSWADPADQVFLATPLVAGPNLLTLNVPLNASLGATFARFRYSSVGGLPYTGTAFDGEVEDYEVIIEPARITKRNVFYNNSFYDANNPGIQPQIPGNYNDDFDAVDTGKSPLMVGDGAATFTNWTGFDDGITGLMYEVALPSVTPAAGDFTFINRGKNGMGNVLVAPTAFQVLPTANPDVVVCVFTFTNVTNCWLEVNIGTGFGLAAPETHWWGNVRYEDGTIQGLNIPVNATDEIDARNNPSGFFKVAPTYVWDYNKDGSCNATDELGARFNPSGFFSVQVITR